MKTKTRQWISCWKLCENYQQCLFNSGTFQIPDQDAYMKGDVKKLVIKSNKLIKNHFMKTIYINKLQTAYKEYLLAKEPANFQ